MTKIQKRLSTKNKGFSLVEVMIASAIAGVLILFIQHTIDNLRKSQQAIERRVEVGVSGQDIKNLLSHKESCRTTFHHLQFPSPNNFSTNNDFIYELEDLKYLIKLEPEYSNMFFLSDFLENYYEYQSPNNSNEIATPHEKYLYEHKPALNGFTPDPSNQTVHLFRQYALKNKLSTKITPVKFSLQRSSVDYYDDDLKTNKLTLLIQFNVASGGETHIVPARIPLYFSVNDLYEVEKCSTSLPL